VVIVLSPYNLARFALARHLNSDSNANNIVDNVFLSPADLLLPSPDTLPKSGQQDIVFTFSVIIHVICLHSNAESHQTA
jgi:hypothetical protein